MQLFGSLKLLMALLGSSCPLFGRSGPKMGPKMVPKNAQKRNLRLSICFFFLIFGHLNFAQDKHHKNTDLKHKLDQHFCINFKRMGKDEPKEPSGASKSLFKNLKKHRVFTRFWVQRPPKKTSRKKKCKKHMFKRGL